MGQIVIDVDNDEGAICQIECVELGRFSLSKLMDEVSTEIGRSCLPITRHIA